MNSQVLQELIRSAAQDILMPRFNRVSANLKGDGSLVTEADLTMQKALADQLQANWPTTGFLGEEMSAEEQQARLETAANGLWVLDPLDGTINFASGVPNFAVSLALLDRAWMSASSWLESLDMNYT